MVYAIFKRSLRPRKMLRLQPLGEKKSMKDAATGAIPLVASILSKPGACFASALVGRSIIVFGQAYAARPVGQYLIQRPGIQFPIRRQRHRSFIELVGFIKKDQMGDAILQKPGG